MSVAFASRTLDDVEIPAPGAWDVDASHSRVGFVARHLMVTKVHGRFDGVTGTVTIGDDPQESSVTVSIDAATIDTGDAKRDGHLRSGDFLDVENHPTLTFAGSGIRPIGDTTFELPGELTIRGVTHPVVLDVRFEGLTLDLEGNTRAAFTASTEIDREEWGLTWNVALETGGVLVGRRVKIELDVQIVRRA